MLSGRFQTVPTIHQRQRPRRTIGAYALVVAICLGAAIACAPVSPSVGGAVPEFVPVDDDQAFVTRPYLQLGTQAADDRLTLMWHALSTGSQWRVEVRTRDEWAPVTAITKRSIVVEPAGSRDIYQADLRGLLPGKVFAYRILRGDTPVFSARARAPKVAGMSSRVVVFGDAGAGTPQQAQVAYQVYRNDPDLVAIAGDIVYGGGRMSEYASRFFPYYNAKSPDPAVGAPLMRSIPFVAAIGNHDAIFHGRPFTPRTFDGFGYFTYWSHPRNGPLTMIGAPSTPAPIGSSVTAEVLHDLVGESYPRTANYSFDYGDAHWTVLDSNPYVDWTDATLRRWLDDDLRRASDKRWRFVLFHHPGVQSSMIYNAQQQAQMRLVCDLFEKHRVAIVFSGHYHNYQRSRPVRFALDQAAWRAAADNAPPRSSSSTTPVPGNFRIDRTFDGSGKTSPDGIIYIVSGAGGAALYEPEYTRNPERWQPYTAQFIADTHSFTVVDIEANRVSLRQVSSRGDEIDRIVLTKTR